MDITITRLPESCSAGSVRTGETERNRWEECRRQLHPIFEWGMESLRGALVSVGYQPPDIWSDEKRWACVMAPDRPEQQTWKSGRQRITLDRQVLPAELHNASLAHERTLDLLSRDSSSRCQCMQCMRRAVRPGVDPRPCPPTTTLCQMSQNGCYDSQGHWENSSAAGLSARMSPAVTPGGLQTLHGKTVCSSTYTRVLWLWVVIVQCTALTIKTFNRHTGCCCENKWSKRSM